MVDTSSILYRVGQKVAELTSGSSSGSTLPEGVIQVNASGTYGDRSIGIDDITNITPAEDFIPNPTPLYYIYGPPNTVPLGDFYQVYLDLGGGMTWVSVSAEGYGGDEEKPYILYFYDSPSYNGEDYSIQSQSEPDVNPYTGFSNQPLFLAPTFQLAQQGYEAWAASQSSSDDSASVSGELNNFVIGLSPDPNPPTTKSQKFYTAPDPSTYTAGGFTNNYGTTVRGFYKQEGDYMHINFSISNSGGGLSLGYDSGYSKYQKISILPFRQVFSDPSSTDGVIPYPLWQADQVDTWSSEAQTTYNSRVVKGPVYIGSAIARGQPLNSWEDGEMIYHLPVVAKSNFLMTSMEAPVYVEQTYASRELAISASAPQVYSWDISYSYRLS